MNFNINNKKRRRKASIFVCHVHFSMVPVYVLDGIEKFSLPLFQVRCRNPSHIHLSVGQSIGVY